MLKGIKIKDWNYKGKTVKLNYEDNTSVLVQRTDFDRAFGNMMAISKETLTNEYMHQDCCQ